MLSLYKQQLNLGNCTFLCIEHEDAIVAVVYKVVEPDGTPLILKICSRPPDYFREIYFLKHFNSILPVASIIDVVEPNAEVHGAILMQCFTGSVLMVTEITEGLAYELGSVLARIHLNRIATYGDLIQPNSLSSDPGVYFGFKFEEGLMECEKHFPSSLLKQCHEYYDKHINLLTSVDGPCIIHRDFRPGNIMVNKDQLQGIIDWASARAGFAEEDFCPLELGEWSTNLAIKKSFLTGYASIRPLPDYAAVMPLLKLNKAIATIGFTVKRGTWNDSASRLYKINRDFLERFFKIK